MAARVKGICGWEGSEKENARGTSHSSLHCFVFRHFPVALNYRRPQRRLSPPGSLAYGKKRPAEEDTLTSLNSSGPRLRLRTKTVSPRRRESLETRRHFHCSLRPTPHAGCEPLLSSQERHYAQRTQVPPLSTPESPYLQPLPLPPPPPPLGF